MGISCISSYRGAQLFEIVGLNEEIIDLCFKNSFKRISGSSFKDIELEIDENRNFAWDVNKKIKTDAIRDGLNFHIKKLYRKTKVSVLKTKKVKKDFLNQIY